MKAVLFQEFGGPEVLHVETVADPEPGPGECLVRVHACGVEPGLDAVTRSGRGGWKISFPHVPGPSAVGEVVTAAGERGPQAGELVAVIPSIVCQTCRSCRQGAHNSCVNREIVGVHRWGGYGEYLTVPVQNLVILPPSVDVVGAAALPVSGVTAWHMVVQRAGVGPGDVVLVTGASGSVGYSAAQIAAASGGRVLIAGRDPERLQQLAEELRPFGTIDLSGADPVAQVHAATDGQGADVVVETVGSATWELSLRAVAVEGRLVSCGGASGWDVAMDLRWLYRRNITMAFSAQGTQHDAHSMFAALAEGWLRPRVARTYPQEQAADAHRTLSEPGGLMGKLVLTYPKLGENGKLRS